MPSEDLQVVCPCTKWRQFFNYVMWPDLIDLKLTEYTVECYVINFFFVTTFLLIYSCSEDNHCPYDDKCIFMLLQ